MSRLGISGRRPNRLAAICGLVMALALAVAWTAGLRTGEARADGKPPPALEERAPEPPAPLFMEPPPASASNVNMAWELVKTGLALALVLALMVLGLKAAFRLGLWGRRSGSGRFKMAGAMPLDNRKYLAAVDVDGHRLILGVTAERISLLACWTADSFENNLNPEGASAASGKPRAKEEQLDQV